jgi:hypothetical protein
VVTSPCLRSAWPARRSASRTGSRRLPRRALPRAIDVAQDPEELLLAVAQCRGELRDLPRRRTDPTPVVACPANPGTRAAAVHRGSVRVWSRRTAGPDGEEFLPTVLRVLRHDVDELVLDRAARMFKTTPATAGLLRQFPCVLTMCSTSAVPVHATDLASW